MKNGYLNNPNLKSAGTQYSYTADEVKEFIKCKNDPIYFIENYVKIVNPDKGLVNLILYDFQKDMINSYWKNKNTIGLCPRQTGKTTTTAAFFCWFIIFNDDKTCAILANKAAIAREILHRLQTAYENLPKFLQQNVVSWNKGSIELENGSRIIAAGTSSSAVRGYSLNVLFLDEFAFVPTNIAEEFFTSVYPTLAAGQESKLIITSTPNGYNHFYKMWTEAEQGLNGFSPIHVSWDAVPGRDEAWKQNQLKILGEEKFKQEHLTEFLGSSNTLIPGKHIKTMVADRPLTITDNLSIYKMPEQSHNYLIMCDPSRGTGNDNTAFIVFDITQYPITIAATYSCNSISPLVLPSLLAEIGKKYNDAYVLVEINDNGQQVADILWNDYEYENSVCFGYQVGIRTDKRVKRIGCTNFRELVETQKLLVNDLQLISEISTFIQKKQSYEADIGSHDDLVMCCVLLGYFLTTPEYSHISDMSMKAEILQQRMNMIEDDLLPFGVIDDGKNDYEESEILPHNGITYY